MGRAMDGTNGRMGEDSEWRQWEEPMGKGSGLDLTEGGWEEM